MISALIGNIIIVYSIYTSCLKCYTKLTDKIEIVWTPVASTRWSLN